MDELETPADAVPTDAVHTDGVDVLSKKALFQGAP